MLILFLTNNLQRFLLIIAARHIQSYKPLFLIQVETGDKQINFKFHYQL